MNPIEDSFKVSGGVKEEKKETFPSPSTPLIFDGVEIPLEIEERYAHFRPSWWMIMVGFLQGMRQVDLSNELGISTGTISNRWRDKEFRQAYSEMNALRNKKAIENFSIVKDNIDTSSVRAEEILVELMEDESITPSVRHSSAKEILYMAGHKPKERLSIDMDRPVDITVRSPEYKKEDDPFEQYKREGDGERGDKEQEEKDLSLLDEIAASSGRIR